MLIIRTGLFTSNSGTLIFDYSLTIIMKTLSLLLFFIACLGTLAFVQAVDIELPEIGDSSGALISPEEERQIGLGFYWRLQQSVDLIDDPDVNSYLINLGYRLVAQSDAPSLAYTFFMVPNTSVNAFAAPGGFIGVHSGLMLTSESEDEVASVLAHEIAHITQRHLLRSFEKSAQMRIPMMAAMISAALLGAADPSLASAAIMAVQAGGVQSRINFTRTNEAEADSLGMQNLVRAGFNPLAMPTFFERLDKASRFYASSEVPEFLRTHPVTTSRIADARGRAVTYPETKIKTGTLQYYLIREKLRVITSTNMTALIQRYEDKLALKEKDNEAVYYGYSLALSAVGRYPQARSAIQHLIDKDRDRLSYQLALAEIEIAVGRLSTALAIYEEYQNLYPDDFALTLNQVKALLRANLPAQASILLLKQLELGAPSRQLYKLLAQAKGDMGDKSQSHSWLAEYYYESGRLEQAADQLRIAAGFVQGDEYQRAKIAARLRQIERSVSQMEDNI